MSAAGEAARLALTLTVEAARGYLDRRQREREAAEQRRRATRLAVWRSEPVRVAAVGALGTYVDAQGGLYLGSTISRVDSVDVVWLRMPGGAEVGPLRRGARPGWR